MIESPALQRNNDHSFTISNFDVCIKNIDAMLEMLWGDEKFDPIMLILSQLDTDAILDELEALNCPNGRKRSDIKPRLGEYQNPATKTLMMTAISRTYPQGTFKIVGIRQKGEYVR